jgi:predicted nuclease of predicted toxin-antitoxin system
MKFLIDMNLAPRWVPYLRAVNFDADHWSSLGAVDAPDELLMAFAAKFGFVVVTQDLDFSAILAATKGKKPSVVQIRSQNVTPEAIGVQVVAAFRATMAELEAGALLTIEPERTRIRLLPLHLDS